MTGYTFGADYDLKPLMDNFGSEFALSDRESTATLTGILDTEWAESDSGGQPTMQRLARILARTTAVRDLPDHVCRGGHMYQGEYEYSIREIMAEYGGLTALVCQVRYAPPPAA